MLNLPKENKTCCTQRGCSMQQHRTALTNPYNLHAVQIADLVVKPYTSNGAIFTSISSFWIHIQHAGSIFMHVILFLVAYILILWGLLHSPTTVVYHQPPTFKFCSHIGPSAHGDPTFHSRVPMAKYLSRKIDSRNS